MLCLQPTMMRRWASKTGSTAPRARRSHRNLLIALGSCCLGHDAVCHGNKPPRSLPSIKCVCRSRERAEGLCQSLGQGSRTADLESVRSGSVSGDVLINTTSIGMQPDVDSRPVPKEALDGYKLVFDAVYTPIETSLLKVHLRATLTALLTACISHFLS